MRHPGRWSGCRIAFLALVTWLACSGGPADADSASSPRRSASPAVAAGCPDYADRLRGGKPVVMLLAPDAPGPARGSEAYGDWQAYRAEFVHRQPAGLCIVRLTPVQYRRTIAAPMLVSPYGVLFIRHTGEVLLQDGMTLEPQVYRIGLNWLPGGSALESAAYGLHEATLRWR